MAAAAAAKHTAPMKLIVKAPNQLIEDQTIDCDLSWNVLTLKEYLSEIYPSKPAISEQKLIYSGQLLTDEALLKDVLRNYEGQKAHSLHLVCMAPRGTPDTWRKSNPVQPVRSSTPSTSLPQQPPPVPEAASTSSVPPTPPPPAAVTSTAAPTVPPASNSWSWLHSTQQQFMAASAQHPAMAAYPTAMMTQMYDPVSLAQMQAVYSQYMAQYLCRLQQAGVSAEALGSLQVQAQQSWNMHQNQQQAARIAPAAVIPGAVPAPANPQQPAQQQMAGADDDDMRLGRQRDWLDWFYVLSRLLVLFSIVYFYSSLKRFVLVSVLGLLLYLYHLGYFRTQPPGGEVENNNRPAQDPVPEPDEPRPHQEQGNEELIEGPDGLRHRRPDTTEEEVAPAAPEPPIIIPPPSVLTVTWTFVSTFFASLIPDRPNVV